MRQVDNEFEAVTIAQLAASDLRQIDALNYGVIGFTADFRVTVYNATESRNAGLSPARVISRHLFEEVAPCMNNFIVAQRFIDCEALDEIVAYVLTLRMRPTPVRLRLLMSPDIATRYLLIDRQVTS
ncbi:phosphonate transporter [Trinickia soli]|uniref:Phosphonate transporter n=1 Tax=Trinickia soli TaxID=380675 RepID=A0A2N7W6C1_9BURK|nr:phosphonate transporter [Trinickia soli]PMS24939.1 phosphonate transporter [Trinickia soli]CAB3646158.1 Photoactive yellow protein [Trinickia soli]